MAGPTEGKPRIFFMGLRKSGKTSIQKVVFQKMSPHETLFIEKTGMIVKTDINNSPFLQCELWDFPSIEPDSFTTKQAHFSELFQSCAILVWVIDIQQEDYAEALSSLQAGVALAARANPSVQVEVLVHKADTLGDEVKFDAQRDVHEAMTVELAAARLAVPLRVFVTSIYDHSVYEALSKVVQRVNRQLPLLQSALDHLLSKSVGDQAFLVDALSKLYVASDSSPVDGPTYELCSDVVDVVVDVGHIYGARGAEGGAAPAESGAVIGLSNGSLVHLQPVGRHTVLVAVMGDRVRRRAGLLSANFCAFRETVRALMPQERAPGPAPGEGSPGTPRA